MDKKYYGSGSWTVKDGREDEFVKRWQDFIQNSAKKTDGNGQFYLLEDEKDPHHFTSFGSWESKEAMDNWRNSSQFAELMGKCQELCDDFQMSDYRLKASL